LNGLQQQVAEQTLPSLPLEKETLYQAKAERVFIVVLRSQSQLFASQLLVKNCCFFARNKGIRLQTCGQENGCNGTLILLSARICKQIAAC
jgi:hypothetical protein